MAKTSVKLTALDIGEQTQQINKALNPTFNLDCKYIDICPNPQNNCYKGARMYPGARCNTDGIRQMLYDLENPVQQITVTGNSNQINQQGNNSKAHMTQSITIDDIPQELIDELKILLKENPYKNSSKWIMFLEKLSKIGGNIATLIKLFQLLG